MAFSTGYTFGFAAAICVTCSLAVSFTAASLKDIQDTNEARDRRGSILTAFDISKCYLVKDGNRTLVAEDYDKSEYDASTDGRLECEGYKGEEIDEQYDRRIRVTLIDGNGTVIPTDGYSEEQWLDKMDEVEEFRLKDPMSKLLGKTGTLTDEQWAEYRENAILAVYQQVDNNDDVIAYAMPVHGVGLWGPIYGYVALQPDVNTVVGATFAAPAETPGLGYEIVNPPFRSQFPGKTIYEDDGDLASISVVKGSVSLQCPANPEHCVQGVSGATMTSNGVDHMFEGLLTAYKPYLDQIRAGRGA